MKMKDTQEQEEEATTIRNSESNKNYLFKALKFSM